MRSVRLAGIRFNEAEAIKPRNLAATGVYTFEAEGLQ